MFVFDMSQELNQIVEQEIKEYQQRKAKIFYEMSIGELLSTHSLKESIEIIKSYLEQLEEL